MPGFSPTPEKSKQLSPNFQHLFLSLSVKCNGENPTKKNHSAMKSILPFQEGSIEVLLQKI